MQGLPNISDKQMEALLKLASAKLGRSTDDLKKGLESEKVRRMTENLSDEQKAKIAEMARDPKKVSELLSNPAVKMMISKYMK